MIPIPIEKDYSIAVSTRPHKKYDIYYKEEYLLSFGDNRYSQYFDSTPIGFYSSINHLDKERRKRYFSRHKKENDKTSARYWSNKYLW